MIEGKGLSVFRGIAIGPYHLIKRESVEIAEKSDCKETEREKLRLARERAHEDLQKLFDKTLKELGEEEAAIIDIQMMMLEDLDFQDSINSLIDEGYSAAYSVNRAGEEQATIFASLDDEYMKARCTDIRDISKRLVNILVGAENSFEMNEKCIIVADDLTPSETIQLDKSKILAFATREGSRNSHTAILARVIGIPSIVQADVPLECDLDGKEMVVDGTSGRFYIDPDADVLNELKAKAEAEEKENGDLETYRGKETISKSRKKVNLFANIGDAEEVEYALKGDAEGIGLMRSEFLYLGRSSLPTEEELFEKYKYVVEKMNGRRVVIRTLDIGADKQADYLNLEKEENPALGYRGIRICLRQHDIFRVQLRAILRASALGPVSIMFPMIISKNEVLEIKEIVKSVKCELEGEGKAVGKDLELGIMIETPAAAVISDELAKEVDFFSVGTNDLTQYTLAIDRQNAKLESFFDPHHPALMRLLKLIAENAHKEHIWVGICGELGSDLALTDEFLKMGYDELSVAPSNILKVRKKIIESEV